MILFLDLEVPDECLCVFASRQRKIQEHIAHTANTANTKGLRLLKYYLCNIWPIVIIKSL